MCHKVWVMLDSRFLTKIFCISHGDNFTLGIVVSVLFLSKVPLRVVRFVTDLVD
jgi:hypothetical protein